MLRSCYDKQEHLRSKPDTISIAGPVTSMTNVMEDDQCILSSSMLGTKSCNSIFHRLSNIRVVSLSIHQGCVTISSSDDVVGVVEIEIIHACFAEMCNLTSIMAMIGILPAQGNCGDFRVFSTTSQRLVNWYLALKIQIKHDIFRIISEIDGPVENVAEACG